MNDVIYKELAAHLDKAIVGVPESTTLLKILEILFPGEEAEVALKLTFEEKTLDELKKAIPEKAESLEDVLARMAKRGTVFTNQPPGAERIYRLLPSVVGFTETPFWAGKETDMTRALAPLWVKYLYEGFGDELARGTQLVRVIPVSESLEDSSQVLPFDSLKERLDEVSYMAVAHCPCRQMRRYIGEGCDHSLENCLHFGSMARYMVEQGMARQVTKEEVLQILEKANEEGLVHVCDNYQGRLSTICNCCACCCVFLQTKNVIGLDSVSPSNYVASVNREECVGCATCEERCPVGAIKVGEDEVSGVDRTLCIGCGVCTPTCASEAVALVLRAEVKPPPEPLEFVTARLKGK
jgi:electron transport complex protein RnfB